MPWATSRFAFACVLAVGCANGADAPAQPAPAPKIDPNLAEPADAMGQHLREVAHKLAPDHVPMGNYFRDRLDHGQQRDFLVVLTADRCYRIVGVGDPAVEDLDLIVFDPAGAQWRQDLDQNPTPVLGADAELCPPNTGAHRLQVRMTAGQGAFLVGVYRTP